MNGNFFTVLLVYVALAFGFLSYVDTMNEKKADEKAQDKITADTDMYSIPHDGDPKTNTINISLNAADFMDIDQDNLTYEWSADDGIALEFSKDAKPDNNTAASFTAGVGTYKVNLTVTDSYGESDTAEKLITIEPEENTPPTIGVINSSLVSEKAK
mgnify:CR=1 FL=1